MKKNEDMIVRDLKEGECVKLSDYEWFTADGTHIEDPGRIYSQQSADGMMVFFMIVGCAKLQGRPALYVNGKETYKRILIQQIYPCVKIEEGEEE